MDIEKIVSQMSLEDKIAFCEGANFWETKAYEKYGIPAMFVCDGPNGLRKQIGQRRFAVILNQADDEAEQQAGRQIMSRLPAEIPCVMTAYRRNKG